MDGLIAQGERATEQQLLEWSSYPNQRSIMIVKIDEIRENKK